MLHLEIDNEGIRVRAYPELTLLILGIFLMAAATSIDSHIRSEKAFEL